MDLLRHLGVPQGTSVIEDRNPQGKDHYQFHAILEAEEADKDAYETTMNQWAKDHDVGLLNHAGRTWKQESIVKAGYDQLVDLSQEYDGSYDPAEDLKTLPKEWPQEYKDAMKDAANARHFQRLRERYQEQIDYNTESEYLGGKGTAVALAAMIVNPETAIMGAGEAALLSKMALKTTTSRFVAGAAIGGLSNTAQELAIIANNKSRDKVGALVAFGTGAALGGGLTAFMKPGSHIDEAIKAKQILGKEYSRAVNTDLEAATKRLYEGTSDVSAAYRGQLDGRLVRDPATGKWYVGVDHTAIEYPDRAAAVAAYRKLEETGYYRRTDPAEVASNTAPAAPSVAEYDVPTPKITQDMASDIDAEIPRIKTYTGPLKSIGAEGMASKNPFERLLTWLTVEFAPGTGGKKIASQSAALTSDMYAMQMRSMFHPERLSALKSWVRETKFKGKPWSTGAADRFDREVFKEIHYRRYPATRPEGSKVNKHVSRMADVYGDLEVKRFKLQQDAGVHGYGGLEPDKLHTSNRWDPTRMNRLARGRGENFVISLIKKGILASKEFERAHKYGKLGAKLTDAFKEERAQMMAKAVYERFSRRPDTVNLARSSYIRVKDRKILEKRLAEAIDNPNTLEHILSSVDGQDSRLLNEYMQQIEVNLNAELDGVVLSDIMDLDLGRQMDSTIRRAAGRAAMAKKGFKDESSWMDVVEQVGEWYRKNTDMTQSEIEGHVTKMQKLWKVVQGDSLEKDPASGGARFLRGLRRAATLTSMNQVGFAQTAEFGRLTGSLGVKQFMAQIPALASMRRSMMNGTFKDPILKDIEAAFDIRLGDNHLLHHPMIMEDSAGFGIANDNSWAITKGLDNLSMKGLHLQGYINGMNGIMKVQQRMHARGFFMRMYDDVMKGNRLSRYADLGLDTSDLKRIRREFETKSKTTTGWFGQERLSELNLASFDPALSEKLALAFHKSQAAAIQRSLGGESPWFMESSFGKMMMQFRNFPLTALEKQTIHDLKFLDFETFTTMVASFGFATLAYMARTYANSFGLPQRKRKQYLKNRIGTPGRIAAGASGWMGQASLLPDMADVAIGVTPFDNPFQYTDYKGAKFRQYSQGIGIDKLGPGPAYLNNTYRLATGLHAAAMNGEEVANDTLRRGIRLIPFSNSLGIINATNMLKE